MSAPGPQPTAIELSEAIPHTLIKASDGLHARVKPGKTTWEWAELEEATVFPSAQAAQAALLARRSELALAREAAMRQPTLDAKRGFALAAQELKGSAKALLLATQSLFERALDEPAPFTRFGDGVGAGKSKAPAEGAFPMGLALFHPWLSNGAAKMRYGHEFFDEAGHKLPRAELSTRSSEELVRSLIDSMVNLKREHWGDVNLKPAQGWVKSVGEDAQKRKDLILVSQALRKCNQIDLRALLRKAARMDKNPLGDVTPRPLSAPGARLDWYAALTPEGYLREIGRGRARAHPSHLQASLFETATQAAELARATGAAQWRVLHFHAHPQATHPPSAEAAQFPFLRGFEALAQARAMELMLSAPQDPLVKLKNPSKAMDLPSACRLQNAKGLYLAPAAPSPNQNAAPGAAVALAEPILTADPDEAQVFPSVGAAIRTRERLIRARLPQALARATRSIHELLAEIDQSPSQEICAHGPVIRKQGTPEALERIPPYLFKLSLTGAMSTSHGSAADPLGRALWILSSLKPEDRSHASSPAKIKRIASLAKACSRAIPRVFEQNQALMEFLRRAPREDPELWSPTLIEPAFTRAFLWLEPEADEPSAWSSDRYAGPLPRALPCLLTPGYGKRGEGAFELFCVEPQAIVAQQGAGFELASAWERALPAPGAQAPEPQGLNVRPSRSRL